MASAYRNVAILSALWILVGWNKPYVPDGKNEPTTHEQKLDYLVVTVDGQKRMVSAGDEFTFVYGAKISVVDAVLKDSKQHPHRVNVVGYTHGGFPSDEDRGREIDTLKDLHAEWSSNKDGLVYAVTVTSQQIHHGTVYFRLLQPELRYAEILINDRKQVMRDGEMLSVRASDKIKVLKVETNIPDDKKVSFAVWEKPKEPSSGPVWDQTSPTHELRFSRGDMVFARIPLKVAR